MLTVSYLKMREPSLKPLKLSIVREQCGTPLVVQWLICGSAGKESTCNAGDLGLTSGWEDPLEK